MQICNKRRESATVLIGKKELKNEKRAISERVLGR